MHSRLTTPLCLLLSLCLLVAPAEGLRRPKWDRFEAKKEVVASFCDVCIAAMIGVVYDLVQFKHLLLQQVEKRCRRLCHGDAVLERHCVETLSKGIVRVLDRAEMGLNPNKICSKFRFCFSGL
ncbi:hypothetical protein QR680_017616 [Steinernema hermaphroditum]|uniref:Saposin B-type domain-containing protein n=1 Tax=Steinernema hermaphroditum TaxID=289476 RepID=A0AA39HHE9_9BILA|nr:hypothetical protein QR680_017616 [Steinernema hermaphroditum]